MHKARKAIIKTLNSIDVLIEIVDARLPYSSQNPIINQWRQEKPTIVILSKTDLADTIRTDEWRSAMEKKSNIKTLAYSKKEKSTLKQINALCRKLSPQKAASFKPINAMIVGIPNVGKSTLINSLAGKIIAKVGNEPAVTKQQQKIYLNDDIILHDTPGMLWPKIENPNSGYRLAIVGSIKNTAIDYEDIGFYAADFFLQAYPEKLKERYKLNTLPNSALECLDTIGFNCGARPKKGRVNLYKAAEILIHDIRAGELGQITLETPAMIEEELIQSNAPAEQEV